MMNRMIGLSVHHRWLVLALTLTVCAWGGWSFFSLPIDAVPDITNNQVQVNTLSQGLSPDDLESKVTYPIEIAMGGLPGVREVRSLTKFGLSQVTVVFEDGRDIYRDRQLVTERLQTVTALPPGVETPTLGPISSGLGEIVHYSVRVEGAPDDKAALMRAKDVQEWIIKPRLLTVPGVAEVNTVGGHTRQLHVQPDISKLARYRLSLADLKDALARTNHNVGGGFVRDGQTQVLIQARGQFTSREDIENVPIKTLHNLTAVRVKDVAQVRFEGALRAGAGIDNGRESVLGTVMMLSGANSRTVSQAVTERLREITSGHELPKDIKVDVLYDRSELVDQTLATVVHNLWVGAVLVILVLVFLLGHFKAALVVSASIPVTLLTTFGLMRWLGISGNLMSLGALDFGIIVDGAVIVVDHCVRSLQTRTEGRLETIARATAEIRAAAGFGQLMIIVVFLPILGFVDIEGKMFRPMAETFAIALAVALILSFTFVPAFAAVLFGEREADKEPWLMRQMQALYRRALEWALVHKRYVLAPALALMLLAGWQFNRLGAEFLPRLDEGSIALQIVRKVDLSLDRSVELQKAAEAALLEFGPVRRVFSRLGTPDVATDPMGPNEADAFILLKDRSEWRQGDTRFRDKEHLIEGLLAHLKSHLEGQEYSVTQPIQMRFNDLLEGTRADLTVKVFGDRLDELMTVARDVAQAVRPVPGAGDVNLEFRGQVPILRIDPNLTALARYSLSAAPVLDAISIGMGGETVGLFFEGLRRVPLVVKLDDQTRDSFEALKRLNVYAGEQLTLPLAQLANFKREAVTSPVLRESSQRRSAVLINPRGRDLQSFVHEAQTEVSKSVKVPPGVRLEWTGAFKNLEDAKARITLLAPLALLLVAAMIYFAFGSVLETALILLTVPLALVGGVLGLWMTGLPFSISAAVGFIALSGIAVLNGVVLIHCFNERRHEGQRNWLLDGASERLRPVLMTALVDIFGFIPMSISTSVGAEVQRPLAVVIICGILTSTALTLFVLPALTEFVHARVWLRRA